VFAYAGAYGGLQEFSGFMTPEMKEDLVVDRSPQGELLRINFNISFPSLSCEFATLDVSDSLGTVSWWPVVQGPRGYG
jgi:hypothetical protein